LAETWPEECSRRGERRESELPEEHTSEIGRGSYRDRFRLQVEEEVRVSWSERRLRETGGSETSQREALHGKKRTKVRFDRSKKRCMKKWDRSPP